MGTSSFFTDGGGSYSAIDLIQVDAAAVSALASAALAAASALAFNAMQVPFSPGAVNGASISTAALRGPVFIPLGSYPTNLSELFLGRTWGLGQWSDVSGNKRAPWHSSISSAPLYTGGGFGVGITTAFNGDFTNVPFACEMFISGASTAGTPTTGYAQAPPNQIPHYMEYYTESGHNQNSTTNDGRTGQYASAINLFHNGQGDATCWGFNIFVNGSPASGGILASPAGAVLAGDIIAGRDGMILEASQVAMIDDGHDVAGIGWNITSDRSNGTGALGAYWNAYRSQSEGSVAIDTGYQCTGKHKIAFDTSFAVLPSSGVFKGCAFALSTGQRIYFNATATDPLGLSRYPSTAGGDFIAYDTSAGGIQIYNAGSLAFECVSGQNASVPFFNMLAGASVTGALTVTGAVSMAGLPTSDPHVVGELWRNSGVVTVSAG